LGKMNLEKRPKSLPRVQVWNMGNMYYMG
jgi:hypothetical protein